MRNICGITFVGPSSNFNARMHALYDCNLHLQGHSQSGTLLNWLPVQSPGHVAVLINFLPSLASRQLRKPAASHPVLILLKGSHIGFGITLHSQDCSPCWHEICTRDNHPESCAARLPPRHRPGAQQRSRMASYLEDSDRLLLFSQQNGS